MKLKILIFIFTVFLSTHCLSAKKPIIRLAVLAFGTVNWELSILKTQRLIDHADFQFEINLVANSSAGKIALQSGAVDIIVSDWIWVSKSRTLGFDFSFYPYLAASGALLVPENSKIKSLDDLNGKKLGIAGGELDKNWLLLQALAQQHNKINLNTTVEKFYAAPPLLNQQILHNRVDAIINYWHYAAKLEAKGYRQIINTKEILFQLGIEAQVPILGYVFNRSWANQNKTLMSNFIKSTQLAKNMICQEDRVWRQIIPLVKTKDVLTQNKLRKLYCQGLVKQWGEKEQQAAAKLYTILRKFSHNRLTGNATRLEPNTFWNLD